MLDQFEIVQMADRPILCPVATIVIFIKDQYVS